MEKGRPLNDEMISLLRALVNLTGRAVFDEERLLQIGTQNKNLLLAYNLCDGAKTQQEIAVAAKLDSGNFSRTVGRWIEAGIVFRVESGDKATLLHVYPLPDAGRKKRDTNPTQ